MLTCIWCQVMFTPLCPWPGLWFQPPHRSPLHQPASSFQPRRTSWLPEQGQKRSLLASRLGSGDSLQQRVLGTFRRMGSTARLPQALLNWKQRVVTCAARTDQLLWAVCPALRSWDSCTSQVGWDYLMYKRIVPIRKDPPTGSFK